MKNILEHKLLIFVLSAFFLWSGFFLLFGSYVSASDNYGLEETAGYTADGESLKNKLIESSPETIAGKLIGALLTWTGVLFLVLIFAGGITWMTAQGNEQKVEKAKQLIVAAIIGLLIVLSAYAITAYIGGTLTG